MEITNSRKKILALKPLIIILFSFLLIMNIANLAFVLIYSSSYFFGSTLLSHISIYSSQAMYLVHSGVSILICSIILYMTIKKIESRYLPILFTLYAFIFLYPFIA